MARPKKPAKGSKASTTLHNYFSKATDAVKKQTFKAPSVSPDEIIVIDSDDDDDGYVKPARSSLKRKMSNSSSDVLVLDATPPKRRASDTSVPPLYVPFGKPTSLLSRSEAIGSSKSSGGSFFGRPSTLLGGASNSDVIAAASNDTEVEIIDIDADNDWATGDDEVEQTATPDDDDEVEILEDVGFTKNETEDVICIPKSKSISRASEVENVSSKKCLPPRLTSVSPPSASSNVFSVLMSSHKENEAWKEASVMEDRGFRPKASNGGRRKAPFYKVLQGMPIAVDAFKYGAIPGITAYFLTHAHSDHYTNLSSSWSNGPIYCSEGTANLIKHLLKVDKNGLTLIEANHCPGSSLFFFEGKQTVNAGDSTYKAPYLGCSRVFRYLHCGDFRASPKHVLHPAVKGQRIDHVYLDTTYLDPKYTFPPQPLVISACAELARRIAIGAPIKDNSSTMTTWLNSAPQDVKGKRKTERILMVVGTYSIGKERIVKAMAQALGTKVYCDSRKAAILRCQCDPDLHALLTSKPLEASVHVVPLSTIVSDKLKEYVDRFKGHFDRAVGFRPTGWTYTQPSGTGQSPTIPAIIERMKNTSFTHSDMTPARNSTSAVQLYMVPYSEHSSFSELTCFAMSFQWGKMIATVNVGSEVSRGKMSKWVQKWEAERQKKSQDYIVEYRHAEYW
ncbi:DNA repair metallo-beta-lactamase-domain-containing protein [Mucidula mucida]|nr:DNA repair metallo-beta-lactamase-domain-containing protein [Mucidula mucida]